MNPRYATINRSTPAPEPFDLEEFLNRPDPKTFDPDRVITASEPFDVDDFIRAIHEGRDVRPTAPVLRAD